MVTLQDFIATLPQDRRDRAKNDPAERDSIAAEFNQSSELPGDKDSGEPGNSFDVTDVAQARGFAKGMKQSHPWLADKVRHAPSREAGWQEMLAVDRKHNARFKTEGGFQHSDTADENDRDYFRWAVGRGLVNAPTSTMDKVAAVGRGLKNIAVGAVKTAVTAGKAIFSDEQSDKLAATVVDGAQQGLRDDWKTLGAGAASLLADDSTDVGLEAQYALSRYTFDQSKNQTEWRKKISESFAAVEVDPESVEFVSEAFDPSNLAGAGLGRAIVKEGTRVGMGGIAKTLAKERTLPFTQARKRAVLLGQADELMRDATGAYADVAKVEARLAEVNATVASNPTFDIKDALLKEAKKLEADLTTARAAHAASEAKLGANRESVTAMLDADGRSLAGRAATATLDWAGRKAEAAGNWLSSTRRGISETATGDPDSMIFDAVADAALPGAGAVTNKANIITRLGRDAQAIAGIAAQGEATLPFFRRLRQAQGASKMTQSAAAFLDWSNVAWATDKVGKVAAAGAAGAPVSGAFGYVASGGDAEAAFEAAGGGIGFGLGGAAYGAWETFRDPRFRLDELVANRRVFRDWLSDRPVNGVSQQRIFDQLPADDQLSLATYAHAHPEAAFRFVNEPGSASGYYDRESNVIVLNSASKTPLADVFRHEVAHFIERHGLEAQVREAYLGNAEKGVVGEYTALDGNGQPVTEEITGPDGQPTSRFVLNEKGKELKSSYEAKVRAIDPQFVASDEYFASELFAEQYADRVLNGGFRRDMIASPVDAFVNSAMVKGFMGKLGLLFDSNDNVVGTGIFKGQSRNDQISKLISAWNRGNAKGNRGAMDDNAADYQFTEADLRNPELATKWLQSGGAMRFGPDGKPVYDKSGAPQYLTEKQAEAVQTDLANELITEIERYNIEKAGSDPDAMQRREIDTMSGKRTVYSGKTIPVEVIDRLEAQKRFNPHQLAHLRAMSASVSKHGVGAMISHFYQAATRKLTGKAYKSVAGRFRRDGIVGFQITKDGNVVVNSVSWEQLHENAKKAAKQKSTRAAYAAAGQDIASAIVADVKTYLDNVISGLPGNTEIGDARRDVINNLFGFRMASNIDANQLFSETNPPKVILTSLRLDRMNRVSPLDTVEYAWGPKEYQRVKYNQRPELEGLSKPDGSLAFPQRRYKGKIKLTHYTREKGLTSIDPKFMGTGAGNSKTTNFRMISGENKSFYFIGGSKPLGSENVDTEGNRYSFTFDPSRLYDMDADPANLWFYPNPVKSEGALKAAGYDGFVAKTEDGREFAALFHPVDVKSGEMTRSAPADTGEVSETSEKPRKTKADREWDAWQKKLARGNGYLSDESDKQYRPESGNPVTRDVAAKYVEQALGRPYVAHTVYDPLPEAQIRRIADYFDTAKHEPKDPGVRGSYDSLIAETKAQYEAMIAAGIEIEPWTKSGGEPYASSADMMKDVAENKHLWFFLTDNGFGSGTALEHPMLEPSGISIGDRELLNNDLFRAVHDYFGHTQGGFQFGPRGEFNAWKSHSTMFSDGAQGALAAETLAQNAWVNNGAHLRDENGVVAKKGEPGYVEPKDRPFAEQKAFVLPAELRQFRPDTDVAVRGVSTASIFRGTEPKPEIGSRAEEIGRGLAARSRKMKRIPHDSRTPEAKAAIAATLADEITHALSQHDNARGWYEAKVAEAMAEFGRAYPEFNDEPSKASLFKAVLAITSNGQKVVDNAKRAEALYKGWTEVGRFESDADWGGARKNQINTGLRTLQRLLDEHGLEATIEFLNRKVTVGELKKLGFDVSGEAVDHTVWGAAIFGPKVGAGFYPNLHGDFTPITMDLWLMRTWNRVNGSYGVADHVGMGRALADLRKAASDNPEAPEAREIGRLSDRQLGNWAEKRFTAWVRDQFRNGTPFDRPAKRFSEAKSGVQEAPRNGSERAWVREVFKEVDRILASAGQPAINNADKQALLWYYEKDLYSLFGYRARGTTAQDYAAAARSVVEARLASRNAPSDSR